MGETGGKYNTGRNGDEWAARPEYSQDSLGDSFMCG